MFPSPLEVDRFISNAVKDSTNPTNKIEFPSPLEVDGFISDDYVKVDGSKLFPSPLEVDGLYPSRRPALCRRSVVKFPSPLEVDRFISQRNCIERESHDIVSVPSRG